MTQTNHAHITTQFGPRAEAYVASPVHASGADLDRLELIASGARPARALDLGTGGGHVAYRLAAHAGQVVACDLSPQMLAAVAATARARGLQNIQTQVAPAEALPFADGAFDFIGCRFSAHHWRDFEAGLREARRVLAPGGTAVFIDAISPGGAALDTHLQAIELLRDTSHGRDYTGAEWYAALARAGFAVCASTHFRIPMEFASWVARMGTPDVQVRAIRALQLAATAEVTGYFAIEADGSFMLDTVLLEAGVR